MAFSDKTKKLIRNTALVLSCLASDLEATQSSQISNNTPSGALALTDKSIPSNLRKDNDKLRELNEGIISWRELTLEEKNDEAFILTGLQGDERFNALNSITQASIENKNIQKAIILTLSENGSSYVASLINADTVKVMSDSDSFKKLLLEDKNLLSERNLWNSLFTEDNNFSNVKEKISINLANHLLDSINDNNLEEVFNITPVPEVIKNHPKYSEIIIEQLNLKKLSEFQTLILLDNSKIPDKLFFKKLIPIINSAHEHRSDHAKELFLNNVSSNNLTNKNIGKVFIDIIRNLKDSTYSSNKNIITSKPFIKLITDEIRLNLIFTTKLDTDLFENSPKLKDLTLKILKEPENIKTLLEYASSVSSFHNVPPIALKIPEINEQFRATCNSNLCAISQFNIGLPDSIVNRLEEYSKFIPEILRMKRKIGSLKQEYFTTAQYISINPNSFANLLDSVAAPSNQAIDVYSRTVKALRILNIQSLNRFDSAKEILNNRFHLADTKIQEELRKVMPNKYFNNKIEDKPYCIFVMANTNSDHNEVFSHINDGFRNTDFIDRLTNYYNVVYYESSDPSELEQDLYQLSKNVKAELVMMTGHGSQGSISLGAYSKSFKSDNESLLDAIRQVTKPKATVALISCSTGSSENNTIDSMHTALVNTLPDCTIIAPVGDSLLPTMELNKNGKFMSLTYADTDGIEYDPVTRKTKIQPGHNFIILGYQRLLEKNRLVILALSSVVLTGLAVTLKLAYNFSKDIIKACKTATKQGKQKLLFPRFFEKSWGRRFFKALFQSEIESWKKSKILKIYKALFKK